MLTKRTREAANSSTNANTTTTIISDLRTSHKHLAPNEYSLATVGIHSCLVRCCESESFAKCFYQGIAAGRGAKDFLRRLNDVEKKLKNDCILDIERCAIVARLRRYLETNETLFEDILKQIEYHLYECMREDPPLTIPQTCEEFTEQCKQRNQAARVHDLAHRMRRFQSHDHRDANSPVNLINLQAWTQSHFPVLVANIRLDSPNRAELLSVLKDLLDNSFFIIQHPSPSIATHTPVKNETVTANVNCRLVCLLDNLHSPMTIDSITCSVCCLSKSNQTEDNNVSYPQSEMEWKTYSIISASNNRKTFSCMELSTIVLSQTSAVPPRQQPTTGKIRYAPFVYRIEYRINVTINFPDDPLPYQHCVIVQSAPFGLITNTCQDGQLFAEVFMEDLKSWKSISTSSSTPTNLTIVEIVDSIKRYFIHKTGIQPKQWVMPYIQRELSAVYNDGQNSMDIDFQNVLAKILAQIDYMAKHPLLILFHDDGFFLGIYDSMLVDTILREQHKHDQKAVCAIRFGLISHMSDAKDIGVRVDLVDKSFIDVQHCTFDTEKVSFDLGLFIVKIASCKASCFEKILSNIIEIDQKQLQVTWLSMHMFVDLYSSEKLGQLCPHEQRYTSIWPNIDSKENKKPQHSDSLAIHNSSQNVQKTTNARATADNSPQCLFNSNISTINQPQQAIQPSQFQYPSQLPCPQQPQYSQILQNPQQLPYSPLLQSGPQYYPQTPMPLQVQTTYANSSNVPQPIIASSSAPQNNQQYSSPPPVIIIFTCPHPFAMSHQNICHFISTHLPQYPSSIPFDRIHQYNVGFGHQSINTSAQTLQNSIPNPPSTSPPSEQNISYETLLPDLTTLSMLGNNI